MSKRKSATQLDRDLDEALYKFRVTIRVQGAPKPVYVSPWTTKPQAEHDAKNHRALITDRGWSHVVAIEKAPR